jgi:lipopolysaccharide transport system ATP-binding protein
MNATQFSVLPDGDERNPVVQVCGLGKRYLTSDSNSFVSLRDALRAGRHEVTTREIVALSDVSFKIREGERIGVIGRNGAGKTTLLSLLAGIAQPSSGKITIDGDVHAILTIGAVLRDEVSGRENIYLDGALHGKIREEVEAYAEKVVEFSELGDFIDRPVRTYSSGMKSRLAFSMAAFIDPDVLIIDETLSVGDVFFAAKASQRMKEIASRGRVVIVVSHALALLVEICDRCLWLDAGRVVMDGDPAEVTKAYERSVEQADERLLAAKFGQTPTVSSRPELGRLTKVTLAQEDNALRATARAFVPLRMAIDGELTASARGPDLELAITRVDGRRVFARRLSQTAGELPTDAAFRSRLDLDPFLLGAGLYRVDLTLLDADGVIDAANRVIEVVDEEGQFGGIPALYCSPEIMARRVGENE